MPHTLSLFFLLLATALGGLTATAHAQERLPYDLALEDLRFFLHSLEQIHPDPYTAYGGKLEFKRMARELLSEVPDSGLSALEIHDLLLPMIAELGDGHTRLTPPQPVDGGAPPAVLPVRFGITTDAIYIARAASGYEDLAGHRLTQVEGRSVETLRVDARSILPAENDYGAARELTRALRSQRLAARLLGRQLESLEVALDTRDGGSATRVLPYAASNSWSWNERSESGVDTEGDAGQVGPIRWRILEPSGTGYLRLRSIEGREAFEEAKGRSDLPVYVSRYYDRYLDSDPPEDLDSALAGIPCFTATVVDLLAAMRERGSEHLVVDVRGNGGGWSSLMTPLYLLVFGRSWAGHPFPDTWIDSASPQFLSMNGWNAEDLAREWGAGYEPGDYRFDTPGSPQKGLEWSEYAASFRPLGCGLADLAEEIGGRPLYTTNVVVLTDPGTFSAAFHLAYTLWRLGALLVGTPSAQAGNAFTNVLRIELPNSRLTGSIARSAQLFFPGDRALGEVLMPDQQFEWQDLVRLGFDPNAELLFALELIADGEADSPLPRE